MIVIELVAQDQSAFPFYQSADGRHVVKNSQQNGGGGWELYVDGRRMDADNYRYDLAERNNLRLRHLDEKKSSSGDLS